MALCGCHGLRGLWGGVSGGWRMWASGAKRGNAQRAIDVHAHFYPEAYLKDLGEQGSPAAFKVDTSDPKSPSVMRGTVKQQLDSTYWDMDARLKRMDKQGVATHALSLTLPMVHWTTPERGVALARVANDAMIAA